MRIQSTDGLATSDYCRVTIHRLFPKLSQFAWNVEKRCSIVGRRWRDLRRLSRDRSATFFLNFAIFAETSKYNCMTVLRLFSKFFRIVWILEKKLFDSRPTVSGPPTTVVWPFSDFSKIFRIAWNVEKKLFDSQPTVSWPPTTVVWPFSDFFREIPNLLERSKKVVWQSANSLVTSDHCHVTVQRLFF